MAKDLLEGYEPVDLLDSMEMQDEVKGNYWLEALKDAGQGFKSSVESVTHGLIQPIAEGGYLGKHVQQGFRPMVERNNREYEEASERSPYATGAGSLAGAIGIRAPAYAATGGSLPALGAIGGAYGAAKLPEGDESRLGNSVREALTDVAGGALLKGLKAAPGFAKSFSGKHNLDKVLKDQSVIKSQYKEAYNTLFKDAEAAGAKNIRAPKIQADTFLKNAEGKYKDAFKDFMKDPTLKGAHKAQSDLGKYIAKMDKSHAPLTSPQIKAVEQAIQAQKKLRGSLFEELNKRTGKGLDYQQLTNGYKKEVVPYSTNKALQQFGRNEISPATTANKLAKNEAFNIGTENKYPELQRSLLASQLANKYLPYTAAGGIGYGAGKLIDYLKGK